MGRASTPAMCSIAYRQWWVERIEEVPAERLTGARHDAVVPLMGPDLRSSDNHCKLLSGQRLDHRLVTSFPVATGTGLTDSARDRGQTFVFRFRAASSSVYGLWKVDGSPFPDGSQSFGLSLI